MAHGENLYILLPNTAESTQFVDENKPQLLNLGGNDVVLPCPHPCEPELQVYQIELSDTAYHEFEQELNDLGAGEALTASQYREKYPTPPDNNEE